MGVFAEDYLYSLHLRGVYGVSTMNIPEDAGITMLSKFILGAMSVICHYKYIKA